ncbi:MAG: hypothetical protein LBH00_08920 [Planctomycetaceae bacterium]|jgi:tetratricopeptide (TPR) repeat protein|nr:hypothetical protein [Planctomycetaceae bacterium]
MTVSPNTLAQIRTEIENELQQAERKAKNNFLLSLVGIVLFFIPVYYIMVGNRILANRPQQGNIADILHIVLPFLFLAVFICAAWSVSRQYAGVLMYQQFLKSVIEPPEEESDYALRADTFESFGYFDEAVADCKTAYELDPQENFLYLLDIISILWNEQHDRDAALEYIDKTLAVTNPDDIFLACVYCYKGKILADSEPDEAKQCFDKAVELDDDLAYVLSRLRFYSERGWLDKIKDELDNTAKRVRRSGNEEYKKELETIIGIR